MCLGHRVATPLSPHAPSGDEPVLTERLDDRERTLDPRVVITWRIFGGLGLLFPLGGASIVLLLLLDTLRWLSPWPWPRAPAGRGDLVSGRSLPRWRWRLTDLALELRHGVLVHQHEAVPYFRIQQIDVEEGPVDRLLGLATLQVTTASASGSGALPGHRRGGRPPVRAELLLRPRRRGDVNVAEHHRRRGHPMRVCVHGGPDPAQAPSALPFVEPRRLHPASVVLGVPSPRRSRP
jgi:uncharacterized protein